MRKKPEVLSRFRSRYYGIFLFHFSIMARLHASRRRKLFTITAYWMNKSQNWRNTVLFATATGTTVLSKYKPVFKPAIVKGSRWAFVSQSKKTADTFPLSYLSTSPSGHPWTSGEALFAHWGTVIPSCCKLLQSRIPISNFPRPEKPVKVINFYLSTLNRNYSHEAELF